MDESLEQYIPGYTDMSPEALLLPPVDVAAALAEDARTGNPFSRFGIKTSVDFGVAEGTFYAYDERNVIWKLVLQSPGATSLNFVFRDFVMPEGSELYLYGQSPAMVMGPIVPEIVFDAVFGTDVIYGDQTTLLAIIPVDAKDRFSIRITEAIHGYQRHASRGFGDSDLCNIDVNCPLGAGWQIERDAVALILRNNVEHCSGSLVNTACQNLRSFFLTAFHCLDESENGSLSNSEKNDVSTWAFRFNYDSPNPVQPDCRGNAPITWITYSGAQFRAAWNDSDFALLELNGSLLNQPTLALAGWDRQNVNPFGATGIHHPDGDVKKIALDDDLTLITGYIGVTGTTHLEVRWDNGITAGGSSGSPLFNPNNRIIGQLHGGLSFCITPAAPDWYGRFFNSWTGGGANDSRLSNWLGGGTNPNTTNSIRIPRILPVTNTTLCHPNTQVYTLENPIPGAAVTWQVTPNLFTLSNATGTGTSVTLTPASSTVSGLVTLTFTQQIGGGCNNVVFTRTFWVGKPSTPVLNPSGYPTLQMNLGAYQSILITSAPGAGTGSSAFWWSTGSITPASSTTGSSCTFEAINTGYGNFYTRTTNVCGNSPNTGGTVNVTSGGGGGMNRVAPNPVRGELQVELSEAGLDLKSIRLILSDLQGKEVLRIENPEARTTLSLAGIRPGVYVLQIVGAESHTLHKVVVE